MWKVKFNYWHIFFTLKHSDKLLKEKVYSSPLTNIQNRIHINNTKIEIQKIEMQGLLLAPDKQQFAQVESYFIMGKHLYKL